MQRLFTKSIYFIALIIIISCNNNQETSDKNEQVKAVDKSMSNNTTQIVNWSITKKLKEEFVSQMKTEPKKMDSLLLKFLDESRNLEDGANFQLIEYKDYDKLNDIVNATHKNGVSKIAKEFEKQVAKSDFDIIAEEGGIYLKIKSSYLKKEISSLLDTNANEFLNLYCEDNNKECCRDAAFVISKEELANRIYKWGTLAEKSKDKPYFIYAKGYYDSYLNFLFVGLDNTPAFDWQTNEFNQESMEAMEIIISNQPSSRASKDFSVFMGLLKDGNMKKTKAIDEYIADRFE